MRDLLRDFRGLVDSDPRLEKVKVGGGVIVLGSMERYPHDQKTPCIALIDGGTGEVLHWSSARRWMPFNLQVHVVHELMDREGAIEGSEFDDGLAELARQVRHVLDMDRIRGKYARVLLKSESEPRVFATGNMHLQEKVLTFEVVRIE